MTWVTAGALSRLMKDRAVRLLHFSQRTLKPSPALTTSPTRLRPTYLRAILHGWEAALKADLELDWAQVADLIRGVLTHDDESAFPVEGGRFDDDANFRPAKQAAVGLLEELVRERAALTVPDEAMSQFAEMLITLADDETAWSEYISYDKESGMDPLTVSLNWQWPDGYEDSFTVCLAARTPVGTRLRARPSSESWQGMIRVARQGPSWERDWQGSC